ncbi:hypothetical protein Tco_1438458 [Tanacetum coccineum]
MMTTVKGKEEFMTKGLDDVPSSMAWRHPLRARMGSSPNCTLKLLNSFKWRKTVFEMVTSMGIRHAKAPNPSRWQGLKLITFKLEGTDNYKVWFAVVQLALHTRNKSRFINGCMSQNLYKGQVFSKIAKDVCDELEETYNKQDGYVIFNLHNKIHTLTQSEMSLSEYYHECNALWRPFDFLVDLHGCTCKGAPKLKKHAQLLRNSNVTSKNVKSGPSAFATMSSNNDLTFNRNNTGYPPGFKRGNMTQNNVNNVSSCDNKTDHSKSNTRTRISDQYQRLMSLLSGTCDASKGSASVATSQHITFCDKILFDFIDVKHLNLTLSHPNRTIAQDSTQRFLMGTGSERGVSVSSPKSCEPNDDGGDIAVNDGTSRNKDTAESVLNADNADTFGSTLVGRT